MKVLLYNEDHEVSEKQQLTDTHTQTQLKIIKVKSQAKMQSIILVRITLTSCTCWDFNEFGHLAKECKNITYPIQVSLTILHKNKL